MPSKQIELLAVSESWDAFVKKGNVYYLLRAPSFKRRRESSEVEVSRAKINEGFFPPQEDRKYFAGWAELEEYLSKNLPKASGKTVASALTIISNAISSDESWHKYLFSFFGDDRADPDIVRSLLIGIGRLESFKNLPKDVMKKLSEFRKRLEYRLSSESHKLYEDPHKKDDSERAKAVPGIAIPKTPEISGTPFLLGEEGDR